MCQVSSILSQTQGQSGPTSQHYPGPDIAGPLNRGIAVGIHHTAESYAGFLVDVDGGGFRADCHTGEDCRQKGNVSSNSDTGKGKALNYGL